MKHLIALIALTAAPTVALAAGGSSSTPPKPTATTQECKDGQVFDETSQECVMIQESSLTPDAAYGAVRELAYAGRYGDAQLLLAAMDQADDRVQTYWGFTHRKMGNTDLAMAAYYTALAQNPDNILARSYMGQHYVEIGALDMAQLQLTEIKARGGRETWAERSLSLAIQSGRTATY
ncbi:MAG: hypothetical protein AAF092_09000 [Pseudomonadota bacterium]